MWVVILAVLGGLLLIGLVWQLRQRQGEEVSLPLDDATDDTPRERPLAPAEECLANLQTLLTVNITVRERDFPPEIIVALESVIDRLRAVLPELNDHYVGTELTWAVNRLAKEHMPRLIAPYTECSAQEWKKSQRALLQRIQRLDGELVTIENVVATGQREAFDAKAGFIRSRFLHVPTNRRLKIR